MTTAEADQLRRCEALTVRELECLRLVLSHHSSKEIARLLGVSQTSINTYVRRAMYKLGAHSRYAAATLVDRWEQRQAEIPHSDSAVVTRRLGGWLCLPPLSSLSLLDRLGMILAGAAIGALGFGGLLIVLARL